MHTDFSKLDTKRYSEASELAGGGWADRAPPKHVIVVLRFLTGVGLGGAMPSSITLTSEYCPESHRLFLVTTMFCGFTIGSALGGIASAHMVDAYG